MDHNEKRIDQEDCHEDILGSGILTLTNKRVVFDKTHGRIIDFSKKFGETVIDISLKQINDVWKEGMFIKKICISTNDGNVEKTYKFGVFSNGKWLKSIQKAIMDHNS